MAGPDVIGYTGSSVISMEDGEVLTCPLDYTDIRSKSPDLWMQTFEELLSHALENKWNPPPQLWDQIGWDPSKWSVFFGWKHIHGFYGNPLVRRAHVTGCPLRQNGSGQNRQVAHKREANKKPLPKWRSDILALSCHVESVPRLVDKGDTVEDLGEDDLVGDWIMVGGQLYEVFSVVDALYQSDIKVYARYEDSEGGSQFAWLYLGLCDWKLDTVGGLV